MVSGKAGRNQAAARGYRLNQHPASMVSGQNGRNQMLTDNKTMMLGQPQWCPAGTAGISGIRFGLALDFWWPQWCPAREAGIS